MTDQEVDYIIRNSAKSGLMGIAYATRKKPMEVMARADKLGVVIEEPRAYGAFRVVSQPLDLDDRIAAYLRADAEVCPKCGAGIVLPWTSAAKKHGVCERCYLKARAEALADLAIETKVRDEYNANKQALYRSRHRKRGTDGQE